MEERFVPLSVQKTSARVKSIREVLLRNTNVPPDVPPDIPAVVGVDFGVTYIFGACAILPDGSMKNLSFRNAFVSN